MCDKKIYSIVDFQFNFTLKEDTLDEVVLDETTTIAFKYSSAWKGI